MTTYIIKTSAGAGSPGYLDEKAPGGMQWQDSNGNQRNVPEGTHVIFTGKNNNYVPPFSQVKILDGMFINSLVWVKSTHVVAEAVTPPVEPPLEGLVTIEIVEETFKEGKHFMKIRNV